MVFFPGEYHGQRSLGDYETYGHKRVGLNLAFPGGSDSKESACSVGDLTLIPGLVRFPGEGNGNPPQYSGLENSIDRGAWQATFHGVTKSWILLSNFHFRGK